VDDITFRFNHAENPRYPANTGHGDVSCFAMYGGERVQVSGLHSALMRCTAETDMFCRPLGTSTWETAVSARTKRGCSTSRPASRGRSRPTPPRW
jgi:hypothetical protein